MKGLLQMIVSAVVVQAVLVTGPLAMAQPAVEPAPPVVPAEQQQPPMQPAESNEQLDEQELGRRILASLADASQRLQDGVIDETTVATQQSAADQIDALLKRLRENAQPTSQQSESDPSTSPAGGTGQQQSATQPNSNRDAARANEDAREGAVTEESEVARRRNLAQAVWGHLPPKVQEELERSFSERFAPKYEELIRRYYEALARQPADRP